MELEPRSRSVRDWLLVGAAIVAALGTATAAILAEVQLSDPETAREQDQTASRAAQERAQAEQVSAWPYATDPSEFPVSKGPGGKRVT